MAALVAQSAPAGGLLAQTATPAQTLEKVSSQLQAIAARQTLGIPLPQPDHADTPLLLLRKDDRRSRARPDATTPRFHFILPSTTLAARLAAFPTDELAPAPAHRRRIAAENHLRVAVSDSSDTATSGQPSRPTNHRLQTSTGRFLPPRFRIRPTLNITSFTAPTDCSTPAGRHRPYRLEGDAGMPDHDEQTVFAYWHERLTDADRTKSRRRRHPRPASPAGVKRLFGPETRICHDADSSWVHVAIYYNIAVSLYEVF